MRPALHDSRRIFGDDKHTEGLPVPLFVGIDVGETPDTLKPFVGSTGLPYPIWLDASTGTGNVHDTIELHTQFGGVGLMTSVFIGADGIIKKIYIGELNRAMLQEWLPQIEPE